MLKKIIAVEERVPLIRAIPLSFQHLFAMFGASVLVPFLFNKAAGTQVIDPSLVLLLNGIGTLIYLFICKGRSPAFLGSSFAFIAPTIAIMTGAGDVHTNFAKALSGFISAGIVFIVVSIIVGMVGTKWLDVVLPPAAMGSIVALIGLELAAAAADMAGLVPVGGVFNTKNIIISLTSLAVVVIGSLVFRGYFAVIPVLLGVVVGYIVAICLGMVDTSLIINYPIMVLPKLTMPIFDINAILIICPAALVVVSEHVGHLVVTSKIVERDLVKDPGLNRSLLGDGISTIISGFSGSVPTTTYGENMGVMAITGVYSVWVLGGAAIVSILIAFIGKLSALISSIPTPVMGGICILLFGVIAASGIRLIVESKVDYSNPKNLVNTAIIFITGLSGISIKLGSVSLKGMALGTVVGILLNLLFYIFEKLKIVNYQINQSDE